MNVNYKIISLLLILFVISITAVSAASDENQTVEQITDNGDELEINEISEDTLYENEGTFAELQKEITGTESGDTLTLDRNYAYADDVKNNIAIHNDITIDGAGNTIDAKNKVRIFYVNPDTVKSVTFKNINFVNGNIEGAGGAIFSKVAAITITNCTFTNNNINSNTGGALYIESNSVKISDSTFTGNSALMSGGAGYIISNKVTVSNCVFNENKATSKLGGALILLGNENTVTNCTFTNNVAGRDGGALDMEGTTVNTKCSKNTVKDCIFTGNTAVYGGALGLNAKDATVTNNVFTKNKAIYSDAEKTNCGLGGAVRVNGEQNTNFDNNTFTDNTAYRAGGAIYIEDTGAKFTNNKFTNNKAENGAGGTINLKCNNAIISNNEITETSAESGGAIYCIGDNAKITENTITKATSKQNGGAIYLQGASATISENKINENTAGKLGGAIFLKGAKATINKNIFNKNTGNDGGAVCIEDGSNNAKLTDNEATNNIANNRAGAFFIRSASATITNNNITANTAKTSVAGGVYVEGKSATITGNNFTSNQATKEKAGALRVSGDNANIQNNNFEKNTASGKGTAIYGDGSNPTVTKNTFIDAKKTDGSLEWYPKTQFVGNNFTADVDTGKTETIITAKDTTYNILVTSKKITATLKDADGNVLSGKELTFTINGATLTAKTDSKGIATVTPTLKTAGSYAVSVNYAGDDTTESAKLDTAKVTVNKDKTKASMAKKTFKKSAKSKKVSFTLKTSAGKAIKSKKITFKVNGKKYTAKTNKKGVATVNLKLTKKGTFKVKASFAGDKTYRSVSKTVKVVIK